MISMSPVTIAIKLFSSYEYAPWYFFFRHTQQLNRVPPQNRHTNGKCCIRALLACFFFRCSRTPFLGRAESSLLLLLLSLSHSFRVPFFVLTEAVAVVFMLFNFLNHFLCAFCVSTSVRQLRRVHSKRLCCCLPKG